MFKKFKALSRLLRELLSQWLKYSVVQQHNPDAHIHAPTFFIYDNVHDIKIGSNVLIGAFSEICAIGHDPRSRIPGRLIIENNVLIGSHANIRAAGGEIFIGQNSMIAQQVSLIASNHQIFKGEVYRELDWEETKTGIYIDENVWIGAGVIVLPGCVIAKNSVVGAGSVVTKSIPPNEIWAGVPARKIRDIEEQVNPKGERIAELAEYNFSKA